MQSHAELLVCLQLINFSQTDEIPDTDSSLAVTEPLFNGIGTICELLCRRVVKDELSVCVEN